MHDIKVLETSFSTLESSMSSQMQELRDMLKLLVDSKISTSPTTTIPNVTPGVVDPLNGASSEADIVVEEEGDGSIKPKINSGSGSYN